MKSFGKTAILTVASLFFLLSQAHAYTISFGGVNAQQTIYNSDIASVVNAGLTANKAGINSSTNTAVAPGWFIETFDSQVENNDGMNTIGGFTTLNASMLTTTGGGYGFAQNNISGAAAPANDATYYFFTPDQGGSVPASVSVDNSDFLAYNPDLYIDYMGLYFGSIDTYNSLEFTLLNGGSFTITGSYILGLFSGTSGNQVDSASNVYVNIDFAPEDFFTGFTLHTTGIALEIDNVVTHVTTLPTPEPSTFILLGAGLFGLVAFGRKKFVG
ncbi:PEP-CTERM sorting domain-containing protein [uncultured Pseudodesulfovibrio sp.]|uniref:PEP-CTERM sorting domain-containing protein n=1 Tax=uncultured Pseudodesulfovibrio sp. TaxID=2035858 RepID=UPI0029C7EE53|nr:PEP-CTERM sorting domain-containing protein [uncultured Pseudodesulfovibrio sp.]